MRRYGELQQRGYPGSDPTVARDTPRWRQAQGQAPRLRRSRQSLPVVAEPHHPLLTARQAAWLVGRRAAPRDEEATQPLAQLRAQHVEVAEAIDLAQAFVQLVRQQQPQALGPWLARAAKRAVGTCQRFAKGLREDDDATKAGVALPWSNGPVEGHITRLKRLKRQMFGRASLALLARRFVLAPGHEPEQGQRPSQRSGVQARPAAA